MDREGHSLPIAHGHHACLDADLLGSLFSLADLVGTQDFGPHSKPHGPMMTGPRMLQNRSMWTGGLLQTVADAIKLLLKELIVPTRADAIPFVVAPMLIFGVSVSAFLVVPFAPALSVADLNIGLLYVLSVSSLAVLSIIMAGWSSNNKYSLLGGLRSAAQMLSYEIPLLFALLGPILMAGTLSMQGIVVAQMELGLLYIVPSFLGAVI